MKEKVSMKEKLCYSIGSAGGNIITQVLATFLMAYYTDTAGVAAAAMATMMLVVRIFDGVSDVVMGAIVDHTRSKWGKARPWLLVSAPLICVGIILLFNVPESMSASAKIVYAYITYIFLNCIAYTMYMVSFQAMLSRITLDGNERQSMTSLNMAFNNIAQLIVVAYTAVFVAHTNWKIVSIAYGIITSVMILICFWKTREHLDVDEKTQNVQIETVPLKVAVPVLLKNKYFYLLAMLFVLALGITSGHGSVTFYYCNIILGDASQMAPLSFALAVPVIIGNIFIPTISRKYGQHKTLVVSAVLMLVGSLIFSVGTPSATKAFVGTVIMAFGKGAIFSCGFALGAQVVDYGEWKYNVRSEGLVNSCISFGQKVGLGLGAAIAGWIIDAGGYVGTAATQTPAAQSAIIFAFGWFTVILTAIQLIVCVLLNLDKHSAQIKAELETRHTIN